MPRLDVKGGSRSAELLAAVDRVCRTDGGATIASVAREAGVTPALIHNRYPEVATAIRELSGRPKRDEVAALKAALQEERRKCGELRADNAELLADLRTLASVNEGLRRQLAAATVSTCQLAALPRRG